MAQYTVQKGDTLSGIAKKVGLGSNWQSLGYTGDPTKLQVGTVLNYGDTSAGTAQTPAATQTSALQPYIDIATSQIAPSYTELMAKEQSAAETAKSTYETLATSIQAREPLVRQTYENLAKELEGSQARETKVTEQVGEQKIGGARAALASAGIEGAQGAFAAPVTAQQNELKASIADIADKYNVKQETLTSQMNSDIQTLIDKATQYRLQGQQEYSKAMIEMAQTKVQMQQAILDQATRQQEAEESKRRYEEQQRLEEAKFKESKSEYYQTEQRLKDEASSSSAAATSKAATKAAAAYKYEPQKDSSGNVTGLNFFDDQGIPTSPWEYFTAKGSTLNEVKKVFLTSENPKDREIATIIDTERARGSKDPAIMAALQYKYTF